MVYEDRFELLELIPETNPDIVICEDFRLYASRAQSKIGSPFETVKVISLIEAGARNCTPSIEPILQMAHLIKGDPPVQVLGEHKEFLTNLKHARDAYKHLRYYTISERTK